MTDVTRPALRWFGGKWMLAPWVISHLPPHRIYVEPFGGAMSVLLRKPPSYAEVYNDLDVDVVNLFRVLRSDAAVDLQNKVRLTPFSRVEFKAAYEPCDDPVEKARRLIIRSFMGFGANGHCRSTGFRSKSMRSGTVPAHDWANYSGAMTALIERLSGVVIENVPAHDIIRNHDTPDTLFYVDPPYVHETRAGSGKHSYSHELSDENHVELAQVLRDIEGMVVLSGYPSPLYERLYKGWHRVERSALADGARKRTEVLWINERAQASVAASRSQPDMLDMAV